MNMQSVVRFIVQLIIFGCIFGVLYFIITVVPIPEPFKGWLIVFLEVLGALCVIGFLLSLAGFPVIKGGPPPVV